jgi:hypothetical protein
MKSKLTRHRLDEVAESSGVSPEIIVRFISFHWVVPADPDQQELDEEDIARIRLIMQLQREFGVNDASMPIILHLIDQLNWLNSFRSIDS